LQPADGLASAGTTFTAPHVSCAALSDPDYLFGEIAGDDTNQEIAAVEVGCFEGRAFEQVRADVDTTSGPVFGVAPGDRIIATEEVGPMGALAQVADKTNGDISSAHTSDTSGLGDLDVRIGLSNASGSSPVPRFHTVAFRSTQVNGQRLAQLDPGAFGMRNPPDPHRVVVTTHLASPYSQGFSLIFKRSS
jgi:hypothetical protein